MAIKIITPPTAEPVTLAEAKAQCRVTGTDEDSLISSLVAAARAMVETELRRPVPDQTIELTIDAFPTLEIDLQTAGVSSIVSVKYVTGGVETTLNSSVYGLDNADPYESWLIPTSGNAWPATDDISNAVKVRFVAGYGSAVPIGIRQWMLLHISAMYDNRSAINEREMKPLSFLDSLIAAERVWRAI